MSPESKAVVSEKELTLINSMMPGIREAAAEVYSEISGATVKTEDFPEIEFSFTQVEPKLSDQEGLISVKVLADVYGGLVDLKKIFIHPNDIKIAAKILSSLGSEQEEAEELVSQHDLETEEKNQVSDYYFLFLGAAKLASFMLMEQHVGERQDSAEIIEKVFNLGVVKAFGDTSSA